MMSLLKQFSPATHPPTLCTQILLGGRDWDSIQLKYHIIIMEAPVVSFIANRLGVLLTEEAKFLYGVSDQVEQIRVELKRMQCFLQDADYAIQSDLVDAGVNNWIAEIRKLAYETEDILETYVVQVSSKRNKKGFRNTLKRFACIFNEWQDVHRVGCEISAIKNKITDLTASLHTYGLKSTETRKGGPVGEGRKPGVWEFAPPGGPKFESHSPRVTSHASAVGIPESSKKKKKKKKGKGIRSSIVEKQQELRQSYQHVIEEDFVGFEEDLNTVVKHLVQVDDYTPSRVVFICGMGGLGKTTLAKNVYHHKDVQSHFHCLAWVCISQQYQTRDILQEIFINLVPERKEDVVRMANKELFEQLYKIQQSQKCLVVLDDIWSIEAWKSLKPAFPNGNTGSKILLTTRNKTLPSQIDPFHIFHEPPCLNDEESWDLLQKKSLLRRDGKESVVLDTNMEAIGRKIVKLCAGLPLAIIVLGGLLATKHTLREWEVVYQNVRSHKWSDDPIQHENGVSTVLALSYHDLPYQLKPCFLYFGYFPEDYRIDAERLYHLWIGDGIIVDDDRVGDETIMDVAKRYLGARAQRCMVQVQVEEHTQRINYCRIHDLMLELCLSTAKMNDFLRIIHLQSETDLANCFSTTTSTTIAPKIRKIAIHLNRDVKRVILPELETAKHLRSILFCNSRSVNNARSSEDLVAQATKHRKSTLEPRRPCSSQQPKSSLERKKSRSSEELKPSGLKPDTRSSEGTPARAKNELTRSSEEKLARAKNLCSQVLLQNAILARSKKPWLERRTKTKSSLERRTASSSEGSKFWAATLCSQAQPTCYKPAHCIPQLRNRKIKDGNNHNTMAGATEPKSGYNKQMGKDRGRYMNSHLKYFKLLRNLDLDAFKVDENSVESIGNLISLRYLSFRDCFITNWHSSICKLKHLQTLDLQHCHFYSGEVIVIHGMEQLRHLYIPLHFYLGVKFKFDGLSNLETLGGFDSRSCDVNDLCKLINLRQLEDATFWKMDNQGLAAFINYLSIGADHLRPASLSVQFCIKEKELTLLKQLLGCHRLYRLSICGIIPELPEYCQGFSPNLIELTLLGCDLEKDPMPTLERLPNLQYLYLGDWAFVGDKMVCFANGFPQLKTLSLFALRHLKEWEVEKGAMPNLSSLEINHCQGLEMVPEGLRFIATLQLFTIKEMNENFNKKLRRVNGEEGEDFYKVRHVSSLNIRVHIEKHQKKNGKWKKKILEGRVGIYDKKGEATLEGNIIENYHKVMIQSHIETKMDKLSIQTV
ncbi:unnamed protein product [Camellia sinensis]